MQYLFCDTEGSVDIKSGLKTFGYVLTDENFNVIEEREVYIDVWKNGKQEPTSNKKWNQPFSKVYDILRDHLTAPDRLIMGFDVEADVKNINRACERFKKAPLYYEFFDVQGLFHAMYPEQQRINLADCVRFLGIEEIFEYHKSLHDARATVAVMKAMCEKQGKPMPALVAEHEEFSGYAEKYSVNLKSNEKKQTLSSCSVEHFKIRVDLPVVYFKKGVGYINERGARDGVVYFYDLTLDRLFRDRHPHKVAKAYEDSLVSGFFAAAREAGIRRLREFDRRFQDTGKPIAVNDYVVSLEFMGEIAGGEFNLKFGKQHLREIERREPYYNLLSAANIEPSTVVKRYYTAETFGLAFRKNAKWNFGDKNAEIVVASLPRIAQADLKEGDALYVPRMFEYVLSERLGPNRTIACASEHLRFAHGERVVELSRCSLPDSRIRLIAEEEEGVFAYLPCECTVHCDYFACDYVVPLLIRRPLPADFFAGLCAPSA